MKTMTKRLLVFAMMLCVLFVLPISAAATDTDALDAAPAETEAVEEVAKDDVTSTKAIAAAITIAVVATAGAIAMGCAIWKSVDSISRQPEADEKIKGSMMLGLVFIETAIIYALIVAILIIFVL